MAGTAAGTARARRRGARRARGEARRGEARCWALLACSSRERARSGRKPTCATATSTCNSKGPASLCPTTRTPSLPWAPLSSSTLTPRRTCRATLGGSGALPSAIWFARSTREARAGSGSSGMGAYGARPERLLRHLREGRGCSHGHTGGCVLESPRRRAAVTAHSPPTRRPLRLQRAPCPAPPPPHRPAPPPRPRPTAPPLPQRLTTQCASRPRGAAAPPPPARAAWSPRCSRRPAGAPAPRRRWGA